MVARWKGTSLGRKEEKESRQGRTEPNSGLRSGAIHVSLEVLKLPAYFPLHAVRNAHDGTHYLVDHARLGFDQRLEISAAQTKHLGRSRGEECAIARLVIHEGQLADQIPRLERVQQRTAMHGSRAPSGKRTSPSASVLRCTSFASTAHSDGASSAPSELDRRASISVTMAWQSIKSACVAVNENQ